MTKTFPRCDRNARSSSARHWAIKEGKIKPIQGIASVLRPGAPIFDGGGSVQTDVVVKATGQNQKTQKAPWLTRIGGDKCAARRLVEALAGCGIKYGVCERD